jgi:hypothetical protein
MGLEDGEARCICHRLFRIVVVIVTGNHVQLCWSGELLEGSWRYLWRYLVDHQSKSLIAVVLSDADFFQVS